MEHSGTIAAIATAMAKAQGDFKEADRDRDNPFFNSTYSTMAAVLQACREALSKNEIAVFQATEDIEGQAEHLQVDTMLVHTSGEWFRTKLKVRVLAMKVEKADRESNTAAVKAITAQAMGSASTYACRIALRSLVVVASATDEDDDGNAASDIKPADGRFLDVILSITSETKPGKDGKRPWTINRIETGEHGEVSTFDVKWAEEAGKYKGTGQQVEIEAKKNPRGFGYDLIGIWPVQAANEAHGGAPAQPKAQAPAGQQAATQAAPAPILEKFRDTIVKLNTKTVAGQAARFGFLTKEHGWVGTSDAKINARLSPLNETGIPILFEAFQNGLGGWDMHDAHEIPPAAPPPPAPTTPPEPASATAPAAEQPTMNLGTPGAPA